MKFFHLSDLHIGLKLLNRDLGEDQEYIFEQIVGLAARERPDAVVIAGDIYDKAVPSADAVEVFDHFIARLTAALPDAAVMMISGNHDSAPRVNCFRSVLSRQKVYMVGNIIIDTLRHNYSRFTRPECLDRMNVADGSYIVFTINRKALLTDDGYLYDMLSTISKQLGDTKVIAPLRGLAREKIEPLAAEMPGMSIVDSMSYLDFGYLTAHAKGIITDSGNIAEEATFNNVPCITLNDYTEHVETVSQGSNVLVGYDLDKLHTFVADMIGGNWKKSSLPERWDGRTADRILQIVTSSAQ